jgi:hypothetical protein
MPPTEPPSTNYRLPLTVIAVIAVLASLAFAFAVPGCW